MPTQAALSSLLVLALCAPGLLRAAYQSTSLTLHGVLFEYELESDAVGRGESFHVLHTSAGQRVRLDLDGGSAAALAGLPPGSRVAISGSWLGADGDVAAAGGPLQQEQPGHEPRFRGNITQILQPRLRAAGPRLQPAGDSAGDGVAGAAALRAPAAGLTTASFPLAASELPVLAIPIYPAANGASAAGGTCAGTSPPLFSPRDIRRTLFESANPGGPTTGSSFRECSANRTRLTSATSLVADPIYLPCSGRIAGQRWAITGCSFTHLSGIASAADAALAARSLDTARFRHRVYLLPPSDACGDFVGMAQIGCVGGAACSAWIGSKYWASPQAYMHELSHNLYLAHAGKYVDNGRGGQTFDPYADDSCVMGYCCANRCPNTPHAWQLGWISLQQLDGGLARGRPVPLAIPSQSLTPARAGLRVVPAWWPAGPPVFVGYRTASSGDAAMGPDLARKVLVYTASIRTQQDSVYTTAQAMLRAGDSWEQPGSGLVVRATATGPRAATITVCRRGGRRETLSSCLNKLDWDCNGLAGPSDPACVPLLKQGTARSRRLAAQ